MHGIHSVLKEESRMGRAEERRLAERRSGEPVPPAKESCMGGVKAKLTMEMESSDGVRITLFCSPHLKFFCARKI